MMVNSRKLNEYRQQCYYDYITALLQCGEYQEVISTPYNLTIKEILKRAKYHMEAYDEMRSFYYEIFGVNFQQWVIEKHVWSELINKWLPRYFEIRRRYGNK